MKVRKLTESQAKELEGKIITRKSPFKGVKDANGNTIISKETIDAWTNKKPSFKLVGLPEINYNPVVTIE